MAQQKHNPTVTADGVPIVGAQPVQEINVDPFVVVLGASLRAIVPSYPVPSGAVVRIKGSNGTNAGNVNPIYVSSYPAGPATEIEPKYEITWPCTNLNQICLSGTLADGAIISVRGR